MLGGITCLALGLAKDSFTWTMVSRHGCALQHDLAPLDTPQPGRAGLSPFIRGLLIAQLPVTSTSSRLHKGAVPAMQVVVVLFSIFVQGACGASFGVVPFVSLRAREDLL